MFRCTGWGGAEEFGVAAFFGGRVSDAPLLPESIRGASETRPPGTSGDLFEAEPNRGIAPSSVGARERAAYGARNFRELSMSTAGISSLPRDVRELYPFVPQTFALPRARAVRMSYLDEGPRDAPVVLMVHGNPSWSFLYRSLVLALRDRFRCIVPDHLGCGLSDKPVDFDYHLGAHIENLGALVDHLGIGRAHLIVHDWGGPIGLGTARRRADFVDRFVAFNTAAFPSRRIPKRIAICRTPFLGALLVRGLNGFSGAAVSMAVTRKLSPGAREAYLFPHRTWATRIAVDRFVRDIPLNPSNRSFAEIETIAASLKNLVSRPALIVWGARDWCFDDVFFAEWKRRLPQARATYLEHAGHWLLEDEPERVANEVRAFLGASGCDL